MFWERRKYDGIVYDNSQAHCPSYEGIDKSKTVEDVLSGCTCYGDDTYGKSFGVLMEFFDLISEDPEHGYFEE
jgi:hypothetical protein